MSWKGGDMRLTKDDIEVAYGDEVITATAGYMLEHLDTQTLYRELATAEKSYDLHKHLYNVFEEIGELKLANMWYQHLIACKLAIDWRMLDNSLSPARTGGGKLEAHEIKSLVGMEQVASRYTKLKGTPKKHGRCPVHGGDKHDAFYVLDERMAYCHTCGWRGDIFKLVMDIENLNFHQAKSFIRREYL
jgi:hypothetical protein